MNPLKHLFFVSKNLHLFFNIEGWKTETIKTGILSENT